MPYSHRILKALIPTNRDTAASWRSSDGKPKLISVQLSTWLQVPLAPASHLPRMHLRWGHEAGMHNVVADLPGYARLALVCSGFSIDVWSEQDDTATPTAQSANTPLYEVNSTVAEGHSITPTKLTYTTRAHSGNATFNETVPPGAIELWTMYVDNAIPPFAPALPPGYLLIAAIHSGAGPAGVQVYQRFDINEVLHNPQPINPLARLNDCGGSGNLFYPNNNYLTFQPETGGGGTETFRIVYGLEV